MSTEGAAEAAPEAVKQAVGGYCQSGWGRLLSVTNAIEAGTWRRETVAGGRLGALEGGSPPPPFQCIPGRRGCEDGQAPPRGIRIARAHASKRFVPPPGWPHPGLPDTPRPCPVAVCPAGARPPHPLDARATTHSVTAVSPSHQRLGGGLGMVSSPGGCEATQPEAGARSCGGGCAPLRPTQTQPTPSAVYGFEGKGGYLGWIPPLCDIPSGCCSFTGPWTVTRSSLRMLRWVATFCRPLRPVLLPVSFPRSRSPVVGVLGLC